MTELANHPLPLNTPIKILKEIDAPPIDILGPQFKWAKGNFYAIIFFLFLDAMVIRQDTVMTQAKQLEANAKIQNNLNNRNAQISFEMLPPGAKTPTINAVQIANQRYAAMREDIQNCLITARQYGQVLMTQTSTLVDMLQQDAAEDSSWLSMLYTISQVIIDMTP